MKTRNCTVVQINGEYKVSQYCQWDGYPDGKGISILDFLRNSNLDKFKENASNLVCISEEEINNLWKECGADDTGFVESETVDNFKEKYPHLYRDIGGGDILKLIEEGEINSVFLDTGFPKNSLWCEWCYVIDFDKKILEVYKGYNKEKLSESDRFYVPDLSIETEYYSVKIVISFDMNNLPSNYDFINLIEKRTMLY